MGLISNAIGAIGGSVASAAQCRNHEHTKWQIRKLVHWRKFDWPLVGRASHVRVFRSAGGFGRRRRVGVAGQAGEAQMGAGERSGPEGENQGGAVGVARRRWDGVGRNGGSECRVGWSAGRALGELVGCSGGGGRRCEAGEHLDANPIASAWTCT